MAACWGESARSREGRDIIHSVTNPINQLTGAIHVYGGDFFGTERSEWDWLTLREHSFDGEQARRVFEPAPDSKPASFAEQLNSLMSSRWRTDYTAVPLAELARHSALMFTARITLAHFSVSSTMSFPNSAADSSSTASPS
jgi:hypothetical protein